MPRVTISIPNELLHRLREIASERKTSIAALVRDALEDKTKSYRVRPRSLGIGDSEQSGNARQTSDERPEPPPWR